MPNPLLACTYSGRIQNVKYYASWKTGIRLFTSARTCITGTVSASKMLQFRSGSTSIVWHTSISIEADFNIGKMNDCECAMAYFCYEKKSHSDRDSLKHFAEAI